MYDFIVVWINHLLFLWRAVAFLCVVVCFSIWLCANSCTNVLFLLGLQKKSVCLFFQIVWTRPNLKNWNRWSLRKKNKKQLHWISPFHMLQIPLQCCQLQSRVLHPVFSPAHLPTLQTRNRVMCWRSERFRGRPGCSQCTATPRAMPAAPTANTPQGGKPLPAPVSLSKNWQRYERQKNWKLGGCNSMVRNLLWQNFLSVQMTVSSHWCIAGCSSGFC